MGWSTLGPRPDCHQLVCVLGYQREEARPPVGLGAWMEPQDSLTSEHAQGAGVPCATEPGRCSPASHRLLPHLDVPRPCPGSTARSLGAPTQTSLPRTLEESHTGPRHWAAVLFARGTLSPKKCRPRGLSPREPVFVKLGPHTQPMMPESPPKPEGARALEPGSCFGFWP